MLAGAVARAIFTGTNYPASLLEAVMLRIRAEREITPGRAAIFMKKKRWRAAPRPKVL